MKNQIALLVAFIALILALVPVPTRAQQAEEKPMAKEQIIKLLDEGIPSHRLASLIKERGVSFDVEDEFLELVRLKGGDDELISALTAAKALADATKWIGNTFYDNTGSTACDGPHGGTLLPKERENEPIEHILTMRCYHHIALVKFEGCSVNIVGKSMDASFKDTSSPEWKFDWSLMFNLRDLDPSSVKSTPQVDSKIESAVAVNFRTTNDRDVMTLRYFRNNGAQKFLEHALSDAALFTGFVMEPSMLHDLSKRFVPQ